MRSTMYWSLLAAGLGLLVCPLTGSAQDQVWDSEIGWAKRVATEFFDSETSAEKTNGYSSSDSVFLSPELAAELRDNRFRWLTKLNWEYHGGRFWIKSAEISPAKTEVVLVCELAPPDPPKEPREGDKKLADKALDVTLWMAKDGGGAWRIRFIRAKVRPVQIQPHEAPEKTELKMKEPPKTAVSMGSPSSKPKKELGETPLRQLANWVRDSTPLGRGRYDSDPNYRMQRLLKESENLGQANAEIHRFWMNNQPSCLSYERLSGPSATIRRRKLLSPRVLNRAVKWHKRPASAISQRWLTLASVMKSF